MTTTLTTRPARLVASPPDTQRDARPITNSLTMSWRALLRIKREPELIIDVVALPVVFLLLFTYMFGGALAGSTRTYLQSLLPGTLVMSVLLITVSAGLSLNTDRTTGALDRLRSLPAWQPSLVVGGLIGDACRYLLSSSLVIGIGAAMGYRPHGGAAGVLAGVALIIVFAFSLSWIWTTLGLVLRSPQAVSTLSFLIQFPLTFASNTFVNPDTMPGWLRAAVNANPVSHLVTAERGLMNGDASAAQIGWVLLAAAGLIAIFAPLTMRLYRSRI